MLDHAPHIPTAHAGGQVGGPGRSRPTIFLFRSKFDVQCSTFDVRIHSSERRTSNVEPKRNRQRKRLNRQGAKAARCQRTEEVVIENNVAVALIRGLAKEH